MYIKQVIIQGFRSYRDQTVIEPFSPKHNVIIGRNGSGKSNFFFAIQFVLSDEFNNMNSEQRQQLLHEGTGPRVVSAFVEIIFDNSDGRIPVDKDEVTVRRVVGSKKDSYYMDKKHVTKGDVMNLLESAGFSRSNPYYIVKQGKINQLALSPDSQRLKLLREVAGTRVYDERKEESKTIIKETEAKREKVDEMLSTMEERLSTLEEEKEELKSYQELDKMRRSLEYTIHDKDLRETREGLEKLEEKRQGNKESSKERHQKVTDAQVAIESLERDLKESSSALQSLASEKRQLQEDDQGMIKSRAKLEFDVKDLEESVADDQTSKEWSRKELSQLEKNIHEKQAALDSLLPRYQEQRDEEEQLKARLKTCEQRRSELFAKQGRGQQFSTVQERDSWIKKEIRSMSVSIETKQEQIHRRQNDVEGLKIKVQQQEQEIKERGEDLEGRRRSLDKARKDKNQLKMKIDDLQNQRNQLWRRQNATEQTAQTVQDELAKCERDLRGTTSRGINQALEAVNKVVKERHIRGVYGPLIENFRCEPRMFTAVENTAGNRLFFFLVDSDKTATHILSIVNKQKLRGDINFFPLDKLRPPRASYPSTQDAIPMVEHLTFDPKFRPAIETVFGKTLICRDLEKASHFARSARLDCITLEGDQASHKGTLTGGYYDTKKSRLDIQRRIWEEREKLEVATSEKAQLAQEIQEVDALVTKSVGEMQKLETKELQLKETFERQQMDVKTLHHELNINRRALEPKERSLSNQEVDLQSMQSALAALQTELGTDLLSQLAPNEQKEVEELSTDIQSLQSQVGACMKQRTKLESQKNTLENLLSSNLLRRREELKQDLEEVSLSDRKQQLEMLTNEFHHLCSKIEANKARMDEVERTLDDHSKKVKVIERDVEKWKAVERDHQDEINEEAKKMERLANKRSLLLKKKEESMHKIRELGSLPSEAFNKYHDLPQSQLWKKLNKCLTELKKYSHVNKKALDQFVNFSDRKEKLLSRKEQLDRDYQAIIELMEVLEHRKHEAIQFTFKQVSKNFSEVFKALVPDGQGQLVMKRSMDVGDESQSEEESSGAGPSSLTFTGVSIRVSFTGRSSETKELQQLSGGQKSLVALALIFAIQKCDPAPFYLFDEIDQALDSHHRHAVAAMIHHLSENAQFITTTFRPELLESADKFYGVTFKNKVSHVRCVSKADAAGFIEEETADK